MSPTPRAPADRFATKFVVAESGCWLWIGARKPSGYGNFQMHPKVFETAHRASWLIHRGEITDGLWVLHKCDNPQCVNPEHLFLGTPSDNTQDMRRKGRAIGPCAGGERSPQHKLKDAQVLEIRALRAGGESLKALSRRYGVGESTISQIANRKSRVTA